LYGFPGIIGTGERMRRRPGRPGRPLEGMDEATLFRAAFPEGWEEMRRVAREEEPSDGVVRERWEAVLELARRALSGDPSPSPEDREVTRRLRSAGGIVGIPVMDHVIIGSCSFYSFREEADW